jgi:hypothetical protein
VFNGPGATPDRHNRCFSRTQGWCADRARRCSQCGAAGRPDGKLKNPGKATQSPLVRRALLLLLPLVAGALVLVPLLAPERGIDLTVSLSGWEDRFDMCMGETPEAKAGKCIQDLAEEAGRRGEIGGGLAILREGVARNQTLTGKCHNATHGLGQATIEQGGTLETAYAVEFPDCRFGFYHGALEAHTADLSLVELQNQMPTLCAAFGGEDSAATGECVHVLGHFVFDRVKPDISAGITTCTSIPEVRLQGRCVDGLLMQGVDLVRGAVGDQQHERYKDLVTIWGEDRTTQQKTVEDICAGNTEGQIVYTCYTNASQALAVLWERDYPAVHAYCESVTNQWQRACFEGIAASGFQSLDWDIKAIADACHAGENENTRYCMQTLALTFALQGTSEQWASVCPLARAYELAACAEGLEQGLAMRASISGGVSGNDGAATNRDDYAIFSQ